LLAALNVLLQSLLDSGAFRAVTAKLEGFPDQFAIYLQVGRHVQMVAQPDAQSNN
jgi:hypothetical protein